MMKTQPWQFHTMYYMIQRLWSQDAIVNHRKVFITLLSLLWPRNYTVYKIKTLSVCHHIFTKSGNKEKFHNDVFVCALGVGAARGNITKSAKTKRSSFCFNKNVWENKQINTFEITSNVMEPKWTRMKVKKNSNNQQTLWPKQKWGKHWFSAQSKTEIFSVIWFMSFGSSGDYTRYCNGWIFMAVNVSGVVRAKFRIFPAWFFSMDRK